MIFLILMACFIIAQIVTLIYKNVGLLTFWILIDYMQLISFLPLQQARCIPWVYEIFRPMLLSHFILALPGSSDMENKSDDREFDNLSFKAYDVDKDNIFWQSLLCWSVLFAIIIVTHIIVKICKKSCESRDPIDGS